MANLAGAGGETVGMPPGGRSPSTPADDPYHQLLSRTRDLRAEQRQARDSWFQQLGIAGKDEVLFELEVLLKAAACFANPRNHPGPPRRGPVVGQDFRGALAVARDGVAHAVGLARSLLGDEERAFVFHRYLETVLPQDSARSRLAGAGGEQTTPEQSLLALRQGLSSAQEVLDGLGRAQRVPYRTFYAALGIVQREVERNTFFNPLLALEFRPEFDRIRSPLILDLIRSVTAREARRLVSLTFLSLFRMLRYLRLLERIAAESSRRRRLVGRAYLTVSVLRSDARALSGYLREHAGPLLADSFHHEAAAVRAADLGARAPALKALGQRYASIRTALESVAASVELEVRRAFRHDLPAPDGATSEAELRASLRAVVLALRPPLRASVLGFGQGLGVALSANRVFDDPAAEREIGDHLRRNAWMFAQILRAFTVKAQGPLPGDRWQPGEQARYVGEFLRYVAALGDPVLRAADYPRFPAFVSAVRGVSAPELIDRPRLDRAVAECGSLYEHLQALFERLSLQGALAGVPFDRRAAARALQLYVAG